MKLRDAVLQVMREAEGPLPIADIKERVAVIDTDPTGTSVGYILTTGSTAEKGRYVREDRGLYRLRLEGEGPSPKVERQPVEA